MTTTQEILDLEHELGSKRENAQRLINAGRTSQALAMKGDIDRLERRVIRARAQVLAKSSQNNHDLLRALAWHLTGEPVDLRWERTGTNSVGTAANSTPPVITLDPSVLDQSDEAVFATFLHECGHCLDYAQRGGENTTSKSREARADQLADQWSNYAIKNAGRYEAYGRSYFTTRILALLNYPVQEE